MCSGERIDREGTREALHRRWRQNLAHAQAHAGERIPVVVREEISTLVGTYLAGRDALFAERIASGAVIDGHGDLLADDVFLLEDGPRILDCLEFDERLRHLDRMDDVASLAADLERCGAVREADAFLATYRRAAEEACPATLVHHFIAYRSFVRAIVGCEPGAAEPQSVEVSVELTRRHLLQGRVSLMLVGGSPGTGKTTVARACEATLGWTVLRSDRVRKELAGLAEGDHASAPIDEGLYTPEWTARTYAELLRRARRSLSRGESVILDATWADESWRRQAALVASETFSQLLSFRCALPAGIADQRIRRRHDDASDADVSVAAGLRARFDAWPDAISLDTRRSMEELVRQVRERAFAR